MSPITQVARSLGLAAGAAKFGARLFANYAMPQVAFVTKQAVKPEDKAKMRQDWEALQSGQNQHRVAVHLTLPGGPIHQLPEEEFLAERYDGLSRELLADRDMLEIYLPIRRADFTLIETYEFRSLKPMDCAITVFAGTEDRSVNLEALMLWREHTFSEFEAHRLPGGHFYLAVESRAVLLELLIERLIALDRASALQST